MQPLHCILDSHYHKKSSHCQEINMVETIDDVMLLKSKFDLALFKILLKKFLFCFLLLFVILIVLSIATSFALYFWIPNSWVLSWKPLHGFMIFMASSSPSSMSTKNSWARFDWKYIISLWRLCSLEDHKVKNWSFSGLSCRLSKISFYLIYVFVLVL